MDILATLGLGFGSAWVSGINAYAMAATLGLLGRFAGLDLPGDLEVMTSWWVIGTALGLYSIEFVADKVPVVDSVWDVVHTFIRIPAGAIVAAAALGDFDPTIQVIALLIGGGLAASSHGTKAAARAAINLSPEPASNITMSLAEDVLAVGSMFVAVFLPVVMLVVLVVVVILTIWMAPKILRLVRRTFATARGWFRRKRTA